MNTFVSSWKETTSGVKSLPDQCLKVIQAGKSASRIETSPEDWTKRCVRQADHILVATNFNGQGRGDVPQKLGKNFVMLRGEVLAKRLWPCYKSTRPKSN